MTDGSASAGWAARLLARVRMRKASEPAVETHEDSQADETANEDEAVPRPSGRVIALLSRRIVWIPAASLVLLTIVGTLSALLWQSSRERSALEAKLDATKHQLETQRANPPPAATPLSHPTPVAAATVPTAPTVATVSRTQRRSSPSVACDIQDPSSVSLKLKDCIDAFNRDANGPRGTRLPADSR